MADNSGNNSMLGVIVGGILVVLVVIFFLGGLGGFGGKSVDVNVKTPSVSTPK